LLGASDAAENRIFQGLGKGIKKYQDGINKKTMDLA
jgi:hypothetical protein